MNRERWRHVDRCWHTQISWHHCDENSRWLVISTSGNGRSFLSWWWSILAHTFYVVEVGIFWRQVCAWVNLVSKSVSACLPRCFNINERRKFELTALPVTVTLQLSCMQRKENDLFPQPPSDLFSGDWLIRTSTHQVESVLLPQGEGNICISLPAKRVKNMSRWCMSRRRQPSWPVQMLKLVLLFSSHIFFGNDVRGSNMKFILVRFKVRKLCRSSYLAM